MNVSRPSFFFPHAFQGIDHAAYDFEKKHRQAACHKNNPACAGGREIRRQHMKFTLVQQHQRQRPG
jgi:hypothetical protein